MAALRDVGRVITYPLTVTPGTRLQDLPRAVRIAARREWVLSRFTAIARALEKRGLSLEKRLPIAHAILAHFWREIGPMGAFNSLGADGAEANYNPANIKCLGAQDAPGEVGWHGDCFRWRVNRALYRNYTDLQTGVDDYIQLLEGKRDANGVWHGRYRPAYDVLLRDPRSAATWHALTLQAGFTPSSEIQNAIAEYAAIYW